MEDGNGDVNSPDACDGDVNNPNACDGSVAESRNAVATQTKGPLLEEGEKGEAKEEWTMVVQREKPCAAQPPLELLIQDSRVAVVCLVAEGEKRWQQPLLGGRPTRRRKLRPTPLTLRTASCSAASRNYGEGGPKESLAEDGEGQRGTTAPKATQDRATALTEWRVAAESRAVVVDDGSLAEAQGEKELATGSLVKSVVEGKLEELRATRRVA